MPCEMIVSACSDCSACANPLYTYVTLVMQHRPFLLRVHDAGDLHGSLRTPRPPHPSRSSAGQAQRSADSVAAAPKASQ